MIGALLWGMAMAALMYFIVGHHVGHGSPLMKRVGVLMGLLTFAMVLYLYSRYGFQLPTRRYQ